jgi:hypothetical protein
LLGDGVEPVEQPAEDRLHRLRLRHLGFSLPLRGPSGYAPETNEPQY